MIDFVQGVGGHIAAGHFPAGFSTKDRQMNWGTHYNDYQPSSFYRLQHRGDRVYVPPDHLAINNLFHRY
jgi:hypothetical protein